MPKLGICEVVKYDENGMYAYTDACVNELHEIAGICSDASVSGIRSITSWILIP